jgi:hypothetical protein
MLGPSASVDDPGCVKTLAVFARVEYFGSIEAHESQIVLCAG